MAQSKIVALWEKNRAYFALMEQIKQQEQPLLPLPLQTSITIAYEMVILRLTCPDNFSCEIKYWKNEPYGFYCSNPNREQAIQALKPDTTAFVTPAYWQNKKLLEQLAIVEEIAAEGQPCVLDLFTNINVKDGIILVEQVNYHNAKLLDATSYYMWDLRFRIPLSQKSSEDDGFGAYKIGTMMVSFHDASKPRNSCADKVESLLKQYSGKH